jgi:hypothetical protein
MGDYFQTLVFRSVTASDAPKIGAILSDFLLTRQIIAGEPSEEAVLGGIGYRPGALALSVCEHGNWSSFLDLLTNGVEIAVGRRIFCEYDGAEFFATCENCGVRFNMMEHEPAMKALTAFGNGEDSAFPCSSFGHDAQLTNWKTEGVTGGFLGLQFWNWWPITQAFQAEVGRLTGSEIFLIKGML